MYKRQGLNPALADGIIHLGMDMSSQYFSGLLLAAPFCATPLSVELAGRKAVSWPYVGLTLQCLTDFGISFSVETRKNEAAPWQTLPEGDWRDLAEARPGCLRVTMRPGAYRPGDYTVEGDWSGASYFLAAGALGRRAVRVRGLRADSLQGDRAMLSILQKMGARLEVEPDAVTVYPSELHGVALDMGSCPDLVPTVAVLAAFAKGSTRISNVAHLRIKESDRINAPATELAKTGVTVDELSDGMLVSGTGGTGGMGGRLRNRPAAPRLPEGATLSAHNDHRMAMSLALLGLRDLVTNVNIPNCGQIPNLPLGAVVETNAHFSADSVRPVFAGPVPQSVYPLVSRVCGIQEMTVEAAMGRDLELAFQAFCMDPNMELGLKDARILYNTMVENTAKYLTMYQ